MANKQIPEIIYHYTSLRTLETIVFNKTIRLSDITKSNDSKEITWIEQYIETTFEDAYRAKATAKMRSIISPQTWDILIGDFRRYWFEQKCDRYAYYVICFSGEEDLPSQWRGYGDDGQGVCIGFDRTALIKAVNEIDPSISFDTICYSAARQRGTVRRQADFLVDQIKNAINKGEITEAYSQVSEGVWEFSPLLVREFEKTCDQLYRLAITMKSDFFKEEKEYRLSLMVRKDDEMISHKNNKDKDDIHFLVKGNGIVSYVDVALAAALSADNTSLIRSVCIGPKCKASKDEMRSLLRCNHIPVTSLCVKTSKGTYR